jgi:ATP-dependent 26S proteasome regulatory subunit
VSQSLKWPLLKLNPGSFTRRGRAGIDQVATELFELLGYLRNVVVLFDEVEDFVTSRTSAQADLESRLLTTAMLPRLQDLRDRKEIVFILATNRFKDLDSAITRPGRFDIVRCVLPPEPPERQKMLDELVLRYELSDEIRNYVTELSVAEKAERFCYGDLQALVRELKIAAVKNMCTRKMVDQVLEHARTRVISAKELDEYIKSKEQFDRPGLRST